MVFERRKLKSPDDFFLERKNRSEEGVYFYRINGYNEVVGAFLGRYYEKARRSGVVIEGRIPNPDEKNLSYYSEIMGMDFQMSAGFFAAALKKWLPRMDARQRESVAASIYDCLEGLRRAGKNDNMLKNAYVKFMCWLYYRFERIANRLGEDDLPKILYEGTVSYYELLLLVVLSRAGADVVLLQYTGDDGYRKADPGLVYSDLYDAPGLLAFPEGFSLKRLREEEEKRLERERLYSLVQGGGGPVPLSCTNAWAKGEGLADIRTDAESRGSDPNLFYNCFFLITGVWDRLAYLGDLYQFYLELKKSGRNIVVVDGEIPQPTPEEIGAVSRKNYKKQDELLMDLAGNLCYTADLKLQRLMRKAFLDLLLTEAGADGMNLNRLKNKAVYLICWMKRYQPGLFSNWKFPGTGCFISLSGCRSENEALFVRFLARLPVDVLILAPDGGPCALKDPFLYEMRHEERLQVRQFPTDRAGASMGTAAYHAERELDSVLYQDSGLYRSRQYAKANVITLRTMYEEIALLWDQELKYRPGFGTVDDVVSLPVIFAKISGVKDGELPAYWAGIRGLLTPETYLIRQAPYIDPAAANPMKEHAAGFLKNGKLLKSKIKAHKSYPYGFLREEIQEYILDKLQLLIDLRRVKGTFENGTEYTIVATVLNLDRELVRLLQNFDFTGKNPKLVYLSTTETMISLEDTILTAFLNLAGFDVVFFVPTGYQSVERFFGQDILEEHQIGTYLYDLHVPALKTASGKQARRSWRDIIFKRG